MDELVLGFVGDGVCFDYVQGAVDGDLSFGVHAVPDPAQPDAVDGMGAGHAGKGCVRGVDEGGVDSVHQPPVYVSGGAAQDGEDGDRDEQSHDGVGEFRRSSQRRVILGQTVGAASPARV